MKIAILLLIFLGLFSCGKKHKTVDSFYTSRSNGDIHTLPLFKPLRLSYDDINKDWGISFPLDYKQRMLIDSLLYVGVDKGLIYGKIFESVESGEIFKGRDTIHLDKYGIRYSGKKINKEDVRIFLTDTTSNTISIPERWFIIDPADSSIEAFFNEADYLKFLNREGIKPQLHNIDSLANVYVTSNVLPWFPEEVKKELRK